MNALVRSLIPRVMQRHIEHLLDEEPAILVEGPRGSGKSTLLLEVTRRRGGRHLNLDDPATAALVREDPSGAMSEPGLVFVDEYQHVPELLSIVKQMVDRDSRPGQVLLAGSVSGRLLPRGTETLTGRVHRVHLLPLAASEILAAPGGLVERLLNGKSPERVESDVSRRGYFDLVVAGGFPAALARPTERARHRWLTSYLATVADRDLPELIDIRHPGAVGRLYRLVAEQTSQIASRTSLSERAGLHPSTTRSYLSVLQRVYLLGELPGWTVGVSAKVARRAKLYVTDTGLGAAALSLDARRLASSSGGGGLLESFVVNEIDKQILALDEPVTLSHFRDRSGVEVDLIVERLDGTVLAVEVKSATRVNRADARGLRLLRDRLGERFRAGLVLHTGPLGAQLEDRIWALPISALWLTTP